MKTPDLSRLFISDTAPEAASANKIHLVTEAGWQGTGNAAGDSLAEAQGFKGKPGQMLVVPNGKTKEVYLGIESPDNLWSLSGAAANLPEGDYIVAGKQALSSESAYKALLGWGLGQYKFRFEDQGPTSEPVKTNRLVVPKEAADRLTEAVNELSATWKVRDLINLPSNLLNTRELAGELANLAQQFNRRAFILDASKSPGKDAFPLIHAVGKASENPPFFTEFAWSGSKAGPDAPRIMIVGKGVTFDTGGVQVKPGDSMKDMRKDMGGAAHALGLAQMIMSNDLPVHINVLVPIAENSISGNAYRPNDVIRAHDGTPVKVGHTDAEGRLILADSLAHGSEQNDPHLILTFATLTGAQRVADGYEVGGVFTEDVAIGRMIEDLGMAWQDELQFHRLHEHLHGPKLRDKNDNTLISSPGGQQPGATLAALFLKHFTRASKATFVHFDINGMNTADKPGKPYGGEAMGMRAAYRYIEYMAGKMTP